MATGESGFGEELLTIQLAKDIISSTLKEYRQALAILRSKRQYLQLKGLSSLEYSDGIHRDQTTAYLDQALVTAKGDLNLEGALCQISDTQTTFHDAKTYTEGGRIVAVRGFLVSFEASGMNFRCFIFDPGKENRLFYDEKNDQEKEGFFKGFAEREAQHMRVGGVTSQNPAFITFVNERRGRFIVEKIAAIS